MSDKSMEDHLIKLREAPRPGLGYSRELREAVIKAIESGMTAAKVASLCGIGKTTASDWWRSSRPKPEGVIDKVQYLEIGEDFTGDSDLASSSGREKVIEIITGDVIVRVSANSHKESS